MKFGHSIDDTREKHPEITDDLLENLQNWAQARDLPEISEEQLALFAHSCYYNLEDTKRCMDTYYRMRATIQEFFKDRDLSLKELQHSLKILEFAILPDPYGNRIIFHRLSDTQPQQYIFNDGIKLFLMSIDMDLYAEGCSPGYIFLFDMKGIRIGHLSRLSISSIRKFFQYLQEGLPIRLKAMHIVNAVWFMDKILTLIRPFIKKEVYEMLHIHTDISGVYPYIPRECLPKDLGGEIDCVAKLHEAHSEKLDQLRDYFQEEERLFRNYSHGENSKTCETKGICSFPHAFVKLTHKQQVLMVGQPYKVNLHLEMPESPKNKELGMFMVCAEMQSSNGNILGHACRSAMLHYRSTLLHTITTLIFSPMMIFGNVEEKQDIVLELFNNFEEDQNRPVTNMYIEIQSKHIELYSATLMINAHLSGLRYWMFNWPILTAGIGTSTILFFITFVCTMSYLHIGSEEEGVEDSFTYEKGDGEHEKILKIMDEIPEEAPDTMRDYSEEKVSASEKRIKGEMGHIQEISTLVSTSSKLDEK